MGGVYVHIPFCATKCYYCSFFSIPGAEADLMHQVLDQIVSHAREVGRRFEEGQWPSSWKGSGNTLYIGGGTPSILPPGRLFSLVEELRGIFGDFSEVTCEANPESAGSNFITEANDAGVTRLSLGVQSLDRASLAKVGRRSITLPQLSSIRRKWQSDLSVDLICGLPGQNQDSLAADISEVITLPVEHLSVYDLSVDPGTRLERETDLGTVVLPANDTLWAAALQSIAESPLERYEVSNFSLPGHECCHNVGYWRSEPFVGLGPSAVSTLRDGESWVRVSQSEDVAAYLDGRPFAAGDVEDINRGTRIREYLMLGLRLASGVSLKRFLDEFGAPLIGLVGNTVRRHCETGLLWTQDGAVGPSRQGLDLLDTVLRDAFWELAARHPARPFQTGPKGADNQARR